jgi:hypothetical protein
VAEVAREMRAFVDSNGGLRDRNEVAPGP